MGTVSDGDKLEDEFDALLFEYMNENTIFTIEQKEEFFQRIGIPMIQCALCNKKDRMRPLLKGSSHLIDVCKDCLQMVIPWHRQQ